MSAIASGYALDLLLGDQRRLHPVAGFGALAGAVERAVWRPSRAVGTAYAVTLVALAAAAAAGGARRRGFDVLLVWTTLGGRSLGRTALGLADALDRGDLAAARAILPSLAGRDPSELGEAELARAAVESVAENTVDAVVAPLVWFAVAGAPAAAAYRAANTLDAMVGHRSERHERFGWAAARLDDVATWPAARFATVLAAALAPVVGGRPRLALRVALRDGPQHPSPNGGLIEGAFAGALTVRLGGVNRYGDRVERRATLGSGPAAGPADVRRAVRLSRAVGAAAAGLLALAR